MWNTASFLLPPITAALLMAFCLSMLGHHVLSRGVIFVDIAVAQVAALGTMIGILMGFAEGTPGSYVFSMVFTLGIAILFSLSKLRHRELSQEVIIGIIYCLAMAMAMLLVDHVSGGSNFIQKTFTGALLWVTWREVLFTLLVFTAAMTPFLLYQKELQRISCGDTSGLSPQRIRFLDLCFYLVLGLAVVQSVRIGGVFVVFMYLIGPAAIGFFVSEHWKTRLWVGWIAGVVASVGGILLSFHFNFPNGPTIVCLLGIILIATALTTREKKNSVG